MIDAETKIFNRVHSVVAPLCAKNKFVSTAISKTPTAFPAASLMEKSNTTIRNRQSSRRGENYVRVMYQLEVYATTKAKCKSVYAAADEAMLNMNFVRLSGTFMDNADNTKVFRFVARYEADIDRFGNMYRPG